MEVGEGVVASPVGGDVDSADEAREVAASPDVLWADCASEGSLASKPMQGDKMRVF